ncbi:Transcriptional regulatory protein WalR [Cellulomonas sp. T2.31MG-18]|uniref:response regulator transcription factor n=1 Tax=Cellulomonas sp. T2.31MG-18 TaxID=3157619 RepID=UPI0035E49CB5
MTHVLVVDDDATVREVVASYLRASGHDVVEVADGEQALDAMRRTRADLVVLDLMLPGIDGLEVCRRLRQDGDVPVIMLTALGAETDRIMGLALGADDYVTKPFSPRELALRVDSVLRRAGQQAAPEAEVLTDGDLVVEPAKRSATLGGRPLALTARELDLLRFLVARAGPVWSRDDLLREVWGWSFGDRSTVTVHVRRLREKVEADPTHPVRLLTVWGAGYRWEAAR